MVRYYGEFQSIGRTFAFLYLMPLPIDVQHRLQKFFQDSNFKSKGAVITDLDGTVVHEFEGLTVIHKDVELGLKKIYETGRPVIINTLRFALSVIKNFAKKWYEISQLPIPVVLLNGSQLGYIIQNGNTFLFEQLAAFPMTQSEIQELLKSIRQFRTDKFDDLVLFYYPEDWKLGEVIWTPVKEKVIQLQKKYSSASLVISTSEDELERLLLERPICMVLLLIDVKEDKLMAYQHTRGNNFITHSGVNKLSGTIQMAKLLEFDVDDSVGAGDSTMDVFLQATGLSVHVRNGSLPFPGKKETIRLNDFHELGDVLSSLARMQQ